MSLSYLDQEMTERIELEMHRRLELIIIVILPRYPHNELCFEDLSTSSTLC